FTNGRRGQANKKPKKVFESVWSYGMIALKIKKPHFLGSVHCSGEASMKIRSRGSIKAKK
ncbi:unnamed protein product, partial [Allacma fusca]